MDGGQLKRLIWVVDGLRGASQRHRLADVMEAEGLKESRCTLARLVFI